MNEQVLEEFVDLVSLKLKERESDEESHEKDRNVGFVQLYEKHMPVIRKLIKDNPLAAEIFHFLIEQMDRNNSLACSTAVFEELTGRSRSTIWRAIKYLKKNKIIEISKMGNINVYHVNANLAWKSYANGRKYAKFNATIILSESEQSNDVKSSNTKVAKVSDNV